MKTTIIITLVFLICISTALSIELGKCNFESGNFCLAANKCDAAANLSVTTQQVYTGNYAGWLDSRGTPSGGCSLAYIDINFSTTGWVAWSMMLYYTSTTANQITLTVNPSGLTDWTEYMMIDPANDKVYYKRTSDQYVVCTACEHTPNTWINYTFEKNFTSNTVKVFRNGNQLGSDLSVSQTASIGRLNFYDGSSAENTYMFIDNITIWNKSAYLYSDTSSPTLTFKEQKPTTLTPSIVFSNIVNITYNVSDATGITDSLTYLNYTLKTPLSNNILGIINGSSNIGFANKSFYKKTGNDFIQGINYSSFLNDNQIYFSPTYFINEETMENTQKVLYNCNLTLCPYQIEILNLSNQVRYNTLEYNINNYGNNPDVSVIYICNSDNILLPSTSQNCTILDSKVIFPINHTHNNLMSNHSTSVFLINETTGKVNNQLYVKDNSINYLRIDINNLNENRYSTLTVINNKTKNNRFMIANETTFKELSYTPDIHIHQNNSLIYSYCSSDNATSLNKGCSISQSSYLLVDKASPIPNIIYSPNSSLNNNNSVSITYTQCIGLNDVAISSYDIYIYKIDSSQTLIHNNMDNISWAWELNQLNYTDIAISINCCDTLGFCSNSTTDFFNFTFINFTASVVVPNITVGDYSIQFTLMANALNKSAYESQENRISNINLFIYISLTVIFLVLLIIGIFTEYKIFISVSGIISGVMSVWYMIFYAVRDNYLLFGMVILFLIISIILIGIGIYLTAFLFNQTKKKKSFYSKFDNE